MAQSDQEYSSIVVFNDGGSPAERRFSQSGRDGLLMRTEGSFLVVRDGTSGQETWIPDDQVSEVRTHPWRLSGLRGEDAPMAPAITIYRLPDGGPARSLGGFVASVEYLLTLNHVALMRTSDRVPWNSESPDREPPHEMKDLAAAISAALGISCVRRDERETHLGTLLRGARVGARSAPSRERGS